MPAPSRDRLARPVDISTLLRGATRRVGLIVDEPGLTWAGLDGYRVRNTPGSGTGGSGSSGSVGRPVGVRAAGFGRGRNIQRPSITGRENRPPATTARRSGGRINGRSQLPSWYPRTPLGDITAITRAIERRRAELRQDQNTEAAHEENDAATAPSNAQLEPEIGSSTPIATFAVKPRTSPAIQIWKPESVDADWKTKNSGFLTPQKKLLNSIEKVREVWLEDQQKLKRTPAAKRAEREKKVRVLMSMR